MPRIDAFLQLGREQDCSDIHFTVGLPPLVRLDGELAPIKYRPLAADEVLAMIDEILDDTHRAQFERLGSIDLSYSSETAGRFRVNVCQQARGLSAVCRVIPDAVVPLAKLALPGVISSFADLSAGLVLVTGATGTGKSTTLAALVNEINERRRSTIITLEDPIEFTHQSKNALIMQREMGEHILSFSDGIRSSLRQDPDVILVGELRDFETISLALEAAETGHLVLGSLHTKGAAQTIDRILDAFPPEAHAQIRNTLADNLRAVVYQELVRAADGRGRRAVVEILIVMPAVAQLIREGKTFQIPSMIATGRRYGMQLMDHALLSLVRSGDIDPDEAYRRAADKKEFAPYIKTDDAERSPEARPGEPETRGRSEIRAGTESRGAVQPRGNPETLPPRRPGPERGTR